jgi:hypothetical protein
MEMLLEFLQIPAAQKTARPERRRVHFDNSCKAESRGEEISVESRLQVQTSRMADVDKNIERAKAQAKKAHMNTSIPHTARMYAEEIQSFDHAVATALAEKHKVQKSRFYLY